MSFGSRFTLGVEEELLLVDPVTRALVPSAAQVLAGVELPPDRVAHEAYAAEVELRSRPCTGAEEAVAELREGRDAARAAGATLAGAGVHPDAAYGDAPIVDAERYRRVEGDMRGLIKRTPECALHVHVGIPDPETGVRAFNGMRRHLPLLEGLAANSPWWFGRDSGMASARAALVRAYPGRGVPRAFHDYADYEQTVGAIVAAGGLEDYTHLWWDVRLQPRLGTIELREMDAQSSLADVAALAALVHALVRYEAEHGPPPERSAPPDALAWSSFRAARDGLDATILHDGRLVPLREAAGATLELARPHADQAIEGIERILREGGGADRRRAARERGGVEAMLDELVEETAG